MYFLSAAKAILFIVVKSGDGPFVIMTIFNQMLMQLIVIKNYDN